MTTNTANRASASNHAVKRGPTFHYHWRWALRSDPASLWPYVSDTGHFNEAAGVPPIAYTELPNPTPEARRTGRIRMYGFPIVWQEEPFEWVQNQTMHEIRHYTIGPIGDFDVRIVLEPRPISEGGGTWLTYDVSAAPGNILGYPGIPVQIGIMYRRMFERAFRQIDAFVQSQAPEPFRATKTAITSAGQTRLRDISIQLTQAGHNPTLVSRLVTFVSNAPDDQLTRLRPFALADQWHVDRYALLEVFLRATRLGLFDLSWDMLCPHCRGAKTQAHALHDVSHQASCSSCHIDYTVDFDHSIEATFSINAAIKPVVRAEYCVGSPQNMPHNLMQQQLDPGETRTITLNLAPGMYRGLTPYMLRVANGERLSSDLAELISGQTLLTVNRATTANASLSRTLTLILNDGELYYADERGDLDDSTETVEGDVTLTLVNKTAQRQVFTLGKTEWSDQACTAAQITSLQSFRDLFSSEALRPGESINVASLSIMFTDLKGSTALYQAIGDAAAFRQVMDHFNILRDSVARHHGALIKTIGDAIMAVFTDPANAVAASLDILHDIESYNAGRTDVDPLILKLGVHQGTCIAVTLNERLDYFGTVVNIAARLEGQSHGDDVVISDMVAADPAVIRLMAEEQVKIEPFNAILKGFTSNFSLRRLSLNKNTPHEAHDHRSELPVAKVTG
jgi:class 3 adenylate cyclase